MEKLTEQKVYNVLRNILVKAAEDDEDRFFDVDMFQYEVTSYQWNRFTKDEDICTVFACGLIKFIRDDLAYEYYGTVGLSIIFMDLVNWSQNNLRTEGNLTAQQVAENFGMAENDDFMTALKDTMGEEE